MTGVPSCFLLVVTLLFSPLVLVNWAKEEEEQIDVLAANLGYFRWHFFAAVSPRVLWRQVGGGCRSCCGALTSGCHFAPFSSRVSR